MYHFFVGTKAQFVKMAPVMLEFERRGMPYRYVDSGQHARLTRGLRATFGVREPDVVLRDKPDDVASMRDAVGWVAGLTARCFATRSRVLRSVFCGEPGVCLIHGDTLSTLFGLLLARRAGLRVAHVEAGLRSHSIWNPFPEELVRIVCMRLSHYLFCPSHYAVENLARMHVKGRVFLLPGNTVLDSLRLAQQMAIPAPCPDHPYALATCHRFETISSKRQLTSVLELLREAAAVLPVLFVQHNPTRLAMERWGLAPLIEGCRIRILPPQDYFSFITLLRQAEFVLTDGGTVQEECYYVGRPCFLMRRRTERQEGIGENIVLGGFDRHKLTAFAKQYHTMTRNFASDQSPSARIAELLSAEPSEPGSTVSTPCPAVPARQRSHPEGTRSQDA